jgi:fumarate reductase subunit C
MSARGEKRLWVIQRATAAVLALCVVVHLATLIYAVRGGLSAAEILSRTRGSFAWGTFYGVFVIAAAAHGSIGLRTVAMEWLGLGTRGAERVMAAVAMALVFFGLRAVYAVVAA